MTEAVFAGENVEKFALEKIIAIFASISAVFARFAENLFLRNCPRDRRDNKRQNYQPENLRRNKHFYLNAISKVLRLPLRRFAHTLTNFCVTDSLRVFSIAKKKAVAKRRKRFLR